MNRLIVHFAAIFSLPKTKYCLQHSGLTNHVISLGGETKFHSHIKRTKLQCSVF